MDNQKLFRICLCGKPNVGKSTLFNRLIGRKKAIVLDKPGVTRDVYQTTTNWNGFEVEIADLAGLEFVGQKDIRSAKEFTVQKQNELMLKRLGNDAAKEYLKTADMILFTVDGRDLPTSADHELSQIIRRNKKAEVILVLTKIEGNIEEQAQLEYSVLGWGEGLPTSAEHNVGVETLKEKILETLFGATRDQSVLDQAAITEQETKLKEKETQKLRQKPKAKKAGGTLEADVVSSESEIELDASMTEESSQGLGSSADKPFRFGVYGRPNVGKSTLVNLLLGHNRMITSPVAGTTVDTVDSNFEVDGKFYQILDTAGIRRKSKTEKGVEVLSVVQAIKSLEKIHLALFLIDGYEGITDQDEKIAGEILKSGRAVILLINKWDLCKVDREEYAEKVRESLGFLEFAPILFVSALNKDGLDPLFELMNEVLTQRQIVASTGELNRFLELVEGTNNPGDVRLYYASHSSKNPPTITIQVNDPKKVHFAYERFLKNELRNRYGWMGSPLKLIFRARKRSASKKVVNHNKMPPLLKWKKSHLKVDFKGR